MVPPKLTDSSFFRWMLQTLGLKKGIFKSHKEAKAAFDGLGQKRVLAEGETGEQTGAN